MIDTSTAKILTLARAGATQQAWETFVAAGKLDSVEASALTLKGRLLKDRARLTDGAERMVLFAQAGAAYQQAAKLKPDSYPLVNAAALSLFAGDIATSKALAHDVLALIDADPLQGETPYWREATRAEALLLLGRDQEAQASLSAAIRLAPQAWEDHAATLRQFSQIHYYHETDAAWLDHLRPAPSLHFSGILGISQDDQQAKADIYNAIDTINPGFGFGALAAGADIIIAEALVARGCELHIVLPCSIAGFRARSVALFGTEWPTRFDALIALAETLTCLSEDDSLTEAAIELADQIALGMALENSIRLESRTVALRVVPALRALESTAHPVKNLELATLAVEPFDNFSAGPPLAPGERSIYRACERSDGGIDLDRFTSIGTALSSAPRKARIALDCGVADETDGALATMLLNAAANTDVIASRNAAMLALANNLCRAIEPLGELPTSHGPVSAYALQR